MVDNHKRHWESYNHYTDYEKVSPDFGDDVVEHDAELSPEVFDSACYEDELDPTQADSDGNDPPQNIWLKVSILVINIVDISGELQRWLEAARLGTWYSSNHQGRVKADLTNQYFYDTYSR